MLPPNELDIKQFLLGALPSKLLHFSMQVLIGIEAGSFAEAVSDHEGGDGEDTKWAKYLALGSFFLSVTLIGAIMAYVHQALNDIRHAKDEALSPRSL